MTKEYSEIIESATAMKAFGKRLAHALDRGDVVLLHGDLGAGKTTLVQGVLQELGINDPVRSPTFTLVNEYQASRFSVYHLDLYRLDDASELETIGYETYVNPQDGVSLIEWPERAGEWLPAQFTLIHIQHLGENRRQVDVTYHGSDG